MKDEIAAILKPHLLEPVDFENLEHNHNEELRFHNAETALLFRNRISVDNYLVFEFDRGRNQVMTFGCVREAHSDNYQESKETCYYLTFKQMQAVTKCMEIIESLHRPNVSRT